MASIDKEIKDYIDLLIRNNEREIYLYLIAIDGIVDIEFVYGLVARKKLMLELHNFFNIQCENVFSAISSHNLILLSAKDINEELNKSIKKFSAILENDNHNFLLNCGMAKAKLDKSFLFKDLEVNAKVALYMSEFLDDGGIYPFNNSLKKDATHRLNQKIALTHALKTDELKIYLQPKVDIHNEDIIGFEALLRWHHPKKGIVSPESFIPTAEQNRLMMRLDLYVMRHVIKLISKSPNFNKTIAINISPSTLSANLFIHELKKELLKSNIKRELIEIEITENSQLLADDIKENLKTLKSLGIQIGIDDFGMGYSSLSYLLSIPFDVIKIDKFFVERITHSKEARSLLHGILSTLFTLNKTLLVEGVENAEQLELLKEMGVQYAQGFYFGKPRQAQLPIK